MRYLEAYREIRNVAPECRMEGWRWLFVELVKWFLPLFVESERKLLLLESQLRSHQESPGMLLSKILVRETTRGSIFKVP
jgi:hypothetical protein